MKTKEKDEKRKTIKEIVIIEILLGLLLFSILWIANLTLQLHIANLTIAQAHSQILNLTHSLAQANATAQALQSTLTQVQSALATQKAQIANLTNFLNLNKSQVIFDKAVSIGPSSLISTCNTYGCYYYPSEANITLHFTFAHAGYIVINTTAQNYVYLVMEQNYSKTWFGENSTAIIGNFNYSVRSLTMPVLPGPATLRLFYYNATAPYEAQLTITYHS